MNTCTAPTTEPCTRKYYGKGLCQFHYDNLRKRGDVLKDPKTKKLLKGSNGGPCVTPECTGVASRQKICNACYMLLPEQRARKAAHYQDNRREYITRALTWQKDNPESRAATNARRKSNAVMDMDDIDKDMSLEYRKAIKNDPCYYCRTKNKRMHYDHYKSLFNGGTDHWWNLVRACARCNHRKNKQDGEQFSPTIG